MRKITVVGIEIGMLLGIVVAAFMVPRSTPLMTFAIISGAVLVLGNVLLIRQMKQVQGGERQSLTPKRNRNLDLIILLFVIYWVVSFLLRKR
jgi:hypothetical protein